MTDNSEALATARAWMERYPVVDGIGAGPASEQAVVDLVAGGVDAVHWSVGGHAEIASWCHSPLAGAGDTTKSALLNMVLHRWLVRRLPDQCVLAQFPHRHHSRMAGCTADRGEPESPRDLL